MEKNKKFSKRFRKRENIDHKNKERKESLFNFIENNNLEDYEYKLNKNLSIYNKLRISIQILKKYWINKIYVKEEFHQKSIVPELIVN